MPVYMRKVQESIPETFSDPSSDEDDFLNDPEEFRDQLPQPFRMINKLLNVTLDEAWQIIHSREQETSKERCRMRPQPSLPPKKIQVVPNEVNCIADSIDGRYVFLGGKNFLAVIEASTSSLVNKYEESQMDLTHLKCALLGIETYILTSIDDMGTARLFCYFDGVFYLMRVVSEASETRAVAAITMEVSRNGDYVAYGIQDCSTQQSWLEIYHIPRENWNKELQSAAVSRSKDTEKREVPQLDDAGGTTQIDGEDTERTSRSQTASPAHDGILYKFSNLALVMKAKPQTHVTGSIHTTLSSMIKPVDKTGSVIGTGTNHNITQSHLDHRTAVFDFLTDGESQGDVADDNLAYRQPTVHFLQSGRTLPFGLDHAKYNGLPVAVCVWWTHESQATCYSLIKSTKDPEMKPELVWFFASPVTCSQTTPCSSWIGFGMLSGNCAFYNKRLGLWRRVTRVSDKEISRMYFMNPPEEENPKISVYPNYGQNTRNLRALVVDKAQCYYIVSLGDQNNCSVKMMETSDKHPNEMPVYVEHLQLHPDIVLRVSHCGTIVLHDVTKCKELTMLCFPEDYTPSQPWSPILALTSNGQCLHIKAQRNILTDDGEEVQTDLFVFHLKGMVALEHHWQRITSEIMFYDHSTVDQRGSKVIEIRHESHEKRQGDLRKRWAHLKDTLAQVQAATTHNASSDVITARGGAPQVNRQLSAVQ